MTNELPDVVGGRYRLGTPLGRGATAQVFRAVDLELGREVAVKVYDSHVVAVEQLRRAREKTLLASVQHPGVVAVFDSGTAGERPYLVMQLVDGGNLAERLCAGPFTPAEVEQLAVRLADALAHVHARQIVHRDLKPANVLLGPGGPLITDFGIAHALDSTRITGTGLVTGTAAYLAPEQILGELAGSAADIYALGLILLECLTAQLEFPGTLAESAAARLHRAPRIPDGTPEPLATLLTRMTAREPGDRPGAAEIPRLLAEPPAVVPAPRRRRALAAAGGLATVTAAAVLTGVLTQPADSQTAPAPLPAAAPPSSSVVVPSPVTLPTASAVVVASSPAAKPVAVGVVDAERPKAGRGKSGPDAALPGDGPAKPPRPKGGKGEGPGKR